MKLDIIRERVNIYLMRGEGGGGGGGYCYSLLLDMSNAHVILISYLRITILYYKYITHVDST